MKGFTRIKQIIAIPDGFTVLSAVTDYDGNNENMDDLIKEGWSYVIALVDGGECADDYVALYEIDPGGWGEICNSAHLIRRRTCPNCNSEMTPVLIPYTDEALKYTCTRCLESINTGK